MAGEQDDDKQQGDEIKVAPDEEKIVVADETQADATVTKKANDDIPVESAIATLKQQLADEQRRRVAAEAQARGAMTKAFQAENEVEDTNLLLVTNELANVQGSIDTLKNYYKQALEAGDYDAVSNINVELMRASARVETLEEGKRAMEAQPKRPPPKPAQMDAVEALASQLTPRSAAWVRAHPEYASNERLYTKMLAAHNITQADGIPVDSNEYFQQIESVLGIGARAARQEEDPTHQAAQVTARRSSPAAAPVSRSGNGTGNPGRVTVMTLSTDQKQAATDMGMTYEDYAKNLHSLRKEGKIH